MDKYYYFAASLPMLSLEGKLPFSKEVFLSDCQRLMDPQDFSLVRSLLEDDARPVDTNNAFYKEWVENVRKFRNEMVFYRAAKTSKDPYAYMRGTRYPEPYFVEVIEHASKSANPLSAEKMMDYVQWQFLDNLSVGHYFDFEFLMSYALKLKILERYDAFNSSKGKEAFDDMANEIVKKSRQEVEAVTQEMS